MTMQPLSGTQRQALHRALSAEQLHVLRSALRVAVMDYRQCAKQDPSLADHFTMQERDAAILLDDLE